MPLCREKLGTITLFPINPRNSALISRTEYISEKHLVI